MLKIAADVNVEKHLDRLLYLLDDGPFQGIWKDLDVKVESFEGLGLTASTSDAIVWACCQQQQVLLLTANRNQRGPDSLEATIRSQNTPQSLPVFTLSQARRILDDREYAERAALQLLEYLLQIDNVRGTGRLYLP